MVLNCRNTKPNSSTNLLHLFIRGDTMKYKSSMEHCPYTCITTDEKALTNKDILNLLNEQNELIEKLKDERLRLEVELDSLKRELKSALN